MANKSERRLVEKDQSLEISPEDYPDYLKQMIKELEISE